MSSVIHPFTAAVVAALVTVGMLSCADSRSRTSAAGGARSVSAGLESPEVKLEPTYRQIPVYPQFSSGYPPAVSRPMSALRPTPPRAAPSVRPMVSTGVASGLTGPRLPNIPQAGNAPGRNEPGGPMGLAPGYTAPPK
jgi:hypothetical protein